MSTETVSLINERLQQVFTPSQLTIVDESHLHAGHAGAQSGKGHYAVTIVASAFANKAPLARHRMIYEALGELMDSHIHALSIHAKGH